MLTPRATSFIYDALPGRVVFANGSSRARLATELDTVGATRVLVVAAEAERGLADELTAGVRDRVVGHCAEVRPHVPIETAERARALARETCADTILCIGGGSTIGTAKAIALEQSLPIVAVPTTYAGSEMTPVWGITERDRKVTGRSLRVQPAVVIYDAELTVSLPPEVSGPSALNALAHCVEAFYAPGANPITSLIAKEGIRVLRRGVLEIVGAPGNLAARADALYGAYLAGAAFAVAGSGLHHKICHALGGAFDLPHALTHAVVLPHVVAFNGPAMPAVVGRLVDALGCSADPASALFDLASHAGVPASLTEIGLAADDIRDQLVGEILAAVPPSNPRAIDAPALRRLLLDATAGIRPSFVVTGAR